MTAMQLDAAWVIMCAGLVLFMQAGFACFESGLSRSKNSINVAIKNVVDLCITALLFWSVGYGVMFGETSGGIIGTTGFAFDGGGQATVFFLFQLAFCGTVATIASGAVAERMKFTSYCMLATIIGGFIYPVFGHWSWNGIAAGERTGWLARLGFVDFAGATTVHSIGAWAALAAIVVLGPRLGRFDRSRNSGIFSASSLPMAALGLFILWFGWIGFNGGSLLKFEADAIARIILNTVLAGCTGGATALAVELRRRRHVRVEHVMNGAISGLVAITASCNAVSPAAAVFIGATAIGIYYLSQRLIEQVWKLDDVVGVIAVHGFCGAWGTLSVALFIPQSALMLPRLEQFGVQLLGILVAFSWSFTMCYILLRLVNSRFPIRVSADDERVGLNVAEHGASTELHELVLTMQENSKGNSACRVVGEIDEFTDAGRIAMKYNEVLDRHDEKVEALTASEARLQAIINATFDCIISIDPAGRITEFNHTAEKTFGHRRQDVLNEQMVDLIVPESSREAHNAAFARFKSDGESRILGKQVELMALRSDGTEFPAEIAINKFEVEGEFHFTACLRDITQRQEAELETKRLQQQLIAAARSAGMAETATGVLHNVGNVLNSVNVAAALLQDYLSRSRVGRVGDVAQLLAENESDLPKFFRSDARASMVPTYLGRLHEQLGSEHEMMDRELNAIIKNVDHIKNVISTQQSIAGTSGVVGPGAIAEAVDDAMEFHNSSFDRYGIEIDRRFEELPELMIDRQKIIQVLVNLIKNAKESILEQRPDDPKLVLDVQRVDGDSVHITVTDNGVGIAPSNLDRIFTHGFTTKAEGHGFGLHSCANAASEMGGSLSVTSPGVGLGASFTLCLPWQPARDLAEPAIDSIARDMSAEVELV